MVHLPDELSFEEGAAMMIQGITALALTRQAYPVQKGDTVLIHVCLFGLVKGSLTSRLLLEVPVKCLFN